MSLIIDLVLVLIFAVFIIYGRQKGFVRTVLTLAASAAGIIVAYKYSLPVAQWAEGAFVKNTAVNAIAEALSTHLANGTQAVIDSVPHYITEAAKEGGVSVQELVSGIGSSVDAAQAAEQIYGAIYNVIVMPVLTVIAFLIIYAIINFVLLLAVRAADKVFKLPGLKGLNKLLGGILGAVKGAATVAILSVVLVTFKAFINPGAFAAAINEAIIPNFIADIILK